MIKEFRPVAKMFNCINVFLLPIYKVYLCVFFEFHFQSGYLINPVKLTTVDIRRCARTPCSFSLRTPDISFVASIYRGLGSNQIRTGDMFSARRFSSKFQISVKQGHFAMGAFRGKQIIEI